MQVKQAFFEYLTTLDEGGTSIGLLSFSTDGKYFPITALKI